MNPPSGSHRSTLSYYETEARPFFERTKDLRIEVVYEPFLSLLPAGAHVLDAGCGSGRDTRRFLEMGYEVTAFDASEAMCALASEHTGRPVLRLRFDELNFEGRFDGVWACASLLHVPRRGLDDAVSNLSRALKPGGVFFASFRYGEEEAVGEDGRLFDNHTERTFRRFLRTRPELEAVDVRRSQDTYRPDVVWLGALLRKRRIA